jgi:hypothetical protein
MWATLALASALSITPNQSGTLQLRNERATYGILGPERKENRVFVGDVYFVAFDIEGLQVREDGRVRYSMGMELTNSKGQSVYRKDPSEVETVAALGGTRLPAFANADIGTDTPPGEYTMKVTVTDPVTKKNATLERKFEAMAADRLGMARVGLSYDAQNQLPAPPFAAPGQTLLLNFAVVGFQLDDKKQPRLDADLTVLDESGKPTLPKPFSSGEINEAPEQFKKILPMQFILQLNRPGKFRLALKATDRLAKKSVEQALDLTVNEPK